MKKQTQELIEMMKSASSYGEYREANRGELSQSFVRIDEALSELLNGKGLKKPDVIKASGLETHYGYQIFSGVKTPTRDKVLAICIGMKLSAEETQQLLKVTGYPQLYGKNERDNAILFGLTKGIGHDDVNILLYDLGLAPLE